MVNEGGQLLLLNGTPYTWKKKAEWNYQMNSFSFPSEVLPGTIASIYIEFNQGFSVHRGDTQGHCQFSVEGTDSSFQVEVRDSPSNLFVEFQNALETPNNPKGSKVDLGWRHDGIVSFILSGKAGAFSSTNPPVDWMHQNLRTLGKRPLSQICMPGTHDAGMGKITWADNIPEPIISFFTQTQSYTIGGQLQFGSRYFDIRPEISMGGWWTGHYRGKLGARGQSIASIIDDVNEFAANNQELVILNLSHATQTDDNFRDLNQDEWNKLMKELLRLNKRFVLTDSSKTTDLSLLTLDELIGQGKAAVICVVEAPSGIVLGPYATQGFYLPSQLNVRNEFTNTPDCVEMVKSQHHKLVNHMPAGDKRLFLISWTLTQQPPDLQLDASKPPSVISSAIMVAKLAIWKSKLKGIRTMAYSANKALLTELLLWVGKSSFPNIVYIDFMESSDYAALAMAVNDKVFN